MCTNNALQVFCRLRPVDTNLLDTDNTNRIIKKSDTVLSLKQSGSYLEHQFLFEHVFGVQSEQSVVFDQICVPLLTSLFEGKNSLIFAYGVTSSGKSFTINGTCQQPGLIPRSIDYIFSFLPSEMHISGYELLADVCSNQYMVNSTDRISSKELFDQKLLQNALNRRKFVSSVLEWSKRTNNIADDQGLRAKMKSKRYAVFVNFVEVYNNYVYDLLHQDFTKSKDFKRIPLNLRKDSTDNVFVVGANEVQVHDANQAIKAFLFGLQNRRMAETLLNKQSSRSHSVFTIKLVSCQESNLDNLTPAQLKVNQISFTDLAGMERIKRTQNTGTKLCEASKINSSLLSLRSCFETIRYNQKLKKPLPIPYRQSKLTRLFESSFEFHWQIRMIICLKPHLDDIDENVHVLSFGKKMQEIVIEDVQNDGDSVEMSPCDISNTVINICQLNLTRFNANNDNQICGDSLIKEMEQFLEEYEKNSHVIFDTSSLLLQRLDTSWNSFPEKQLDKRNIHLNAFKKRFTLFNKQLKDMYKRKSPRTSLPITNIANTPLVCSPKKIDHLLVSRKRYIIQEVYRDIQHWESDTLDYNNKLNSFVRDGYQSLKTYFNCLLTQNQAKMDVFTRLYNQTPARYKIHSKVSQMAQNLQLKNKAADNCAKSELSTVVTRHRVKDLKKLFTPAANSVNVTTTLSQYKMANSFNAKPAIISRCNTKLSKQCASVTRSVLASTTVNTNHNPSVNLDSKDNSMKGIYSKRRLF